MNAKSKIYYFRLAISSLVGLLSGLINLGPLEGLSLFLLTYFLVTPISLRLWGRDLREMGLMKIYREGLGSSILALLLVWTLAINLVGPGVPMYVVRTGQSGIFPLQTVEGRVIGPNEASLVGYNAVLLNLTNDNKIEDMLVGTYAKDLGNYVEVNLRRTRVVLYKNGTVLIEGTYSLSDSTDMKRLHKIFGNITLYRNGTLLLNSTTLVPGGSSTIKLGEASIEVSYLSKGIITLKTTALANENNISFPADAFISKIVRKDGYIYIFDALKPSWRTRTARVDDSYIIVLPPR
ncbi:MAG: hypothetical protein DRN78_00400 [Thermoproteota archaeon]|nr:MAG: hypothetical protein DRN78_00400 [Candidatus Korarchaeota archaeon]